MFKKNSTLILLIILIIPELIFSPILNIVYSLVKPSNFLIRDNVLFRGDVSIIYLNIMLLIQLFGSIALSYLMFKNIQRNNFLYLFLGTLFVFISLLILLSLFVANIFSGVGF